MFVEESRRAAVDEGRARSGIDERHRNAEVLVDLAQLSEIREFAGARHVTDSREECVLYERPQQHVGTEPGRVRSRVVEQRRQCDRRVTDEELIAVATYGLTCSIQVKQ